MTEIRINAADLEISINVALSQRENASPNGWEKGDRDSTDVAYMNELYRQMNFYVGKLKDWALLSPAERGAVRHNIPTVWEELHGLLKGE